MQGRIAKRVAKIKADVEVRKEEFAGDRAQLRADLAVDEASAAIADASGAIEYARFAVLRAAAARAGRGCIGALERSVRSRLALS